MKKRRTIDLIREAYPDLTWRYEWPSRYVSSAGWDIQAYSSCSVTASGEEVFRTTWRRSDTGEEVYPGYNFRTLLELVF